MTLPREEFHL